ncbi:GNAT family N-acetyltransferase [Acinetobacter sp. Marseille-Q1618]|uniref:GNAT family N-acetyltransferase n=1 Tax=Acinetobacter sp. Marseille-Q1618 TaxID=2697502 RepID=UPI001570A8A3|nr:GNAT family N-acetyltransferase [Acinetobacter sp. Marseille-Q1618]
MSYYKLETHRLRLRQWQGSDLIAFAALNADPEVMQYFPKCLNSDESELLATRFHHLIHKHQWGFWAVELKENQKFIGFVGLHAQPEQFTFSPCVEIGWRLAKQYWHYGYATEAAQACLAFAFEVLKLDAVVAFTAYPNLASAKVMQRLGMTYLYDFNHPRLRQDHLLSRHVLYQIKHSEFLAQAHTRHFYSYSCISDD